MKLQDCQLCGARLSEREIRACQADPQIQDNTYFCELHRRRFSACAAVRQNPGKATGH